MKGVSSLLAIVALAAQLVSASEHEDLLLQAMDSELDRSMAAYQSQAVPAYFIAYRVADESSLTLQAESGLLTRRRERQKRVLNVDLRVGSHELDNAVPLRSDRAQFGGFRNQWTEIPLTPDAAPMRHVIWQATDRAYQQALESYARVKANASVAVAGEDQSASLSREAPVVLLEPEVAVELDQWFWQQKVEMLSRPFKQHAHVLRSRVAVNASRKVQWLTNTEGTRVRTAQVTYRLTLWAVAKAEDGMELPLRETILARDLNDFPSDAILLQRVQDMVGNLDRLRRAPVMTAYQGPAILEGAAAGVFFHELLGHRVEGHRLTLESDAQTFKEKLGMQLLPAGFNLYFDPTVDRFETQPLMGSYRVDDQGVSAQRVDVIADGKLKGFLMSRKPVRGFSRSNGHGRAGQYRTPVARQSNLFVSSEKALTPAALRRRLLDEVRAQNKPFGLLLQGMVGGATNTGRGWGNTINIVPTMTSRLYPDGREELVRGVYIIGTPLVALGEVQAASDQHVVSHGWCGAESGFVPVSIVAPDILISRIEVQRANKSQERLPLLPSPVNPDQRP